jgi:hypothetical protein
LEKGGKFTVPVITPVVKLTAVVVIVPDPLVMDSQGVPNKQVTVAGVHKTALSPPVLPGETPTIAPCRLMAVAYVDGGTYVGSRGGSICVPLLLL